MLMLLNVVTILHYFQAQTHLYDAEASRYFTESSGTLKTHSAPSDDITNARLTVRPRHGRFWDDTTATAPLYGSTVSRDSFGNASPSSSSLSANWTFLLCEECLQVVQYAPRVEITKPVQTRSDERKFLSYFYLKEAGRHPFQGALDAQGRSGFQYDVTSLRRNPPSFVDSFPNLTAECLRRDNEYYALQRLRIHSPSPEQSTTATRLSQSSTPARILCVVYSSEPFHHKLQAARQTWAPKCDGFFAASNVTDPTFDAVNIVHNGPEQYKNMWQKVRSIWATLYELYYEDFDWFHLGGDDMWLLVENLRMYLESDEIRAAANGGFSDTLPLGVQSGNNNSIWVQPDQVPLYLGSRLAFRSNTRTLYNTGGPGYTLNKAALKLLVTEGLPVMHSQLRTSAEDLRVAEVFRRFRVLPYPTHDRDGGERYHHFTPGLHQLSAMPKAHDWFDKWATPLGWKGGWNHSSVYSVAFHGINSNEMRRFHALVYKYCDRHNPAGDNEGRELDEDKTQFELPFFEGGNNTGWATGSNFANVEVGSVSEAMSPIHRAARQQLEQISSERGRLDWSMTVKR
jgi:hypothetical protein